MAPRNYKNLDLELAKAKLRFYENNFRVSKPPPKSNTTTTNPNSRLTSLLDTYTRTIGEDGGVTISMRLNDTTTMTSAPDGALTIHSQNGLMGMPARLGMGLSEMAFKMEVAKWKAEKAEEADDEDEEEKEVKNEGTSGAGLRPQNVPGASTRYSSAPGYYNNGKRIPLPPPTPAPWDYVSPQERLAQYQLRKIEQMEDGMAKDHAMKAWEEAAQCRHEREVYYAAQEAKDAEAEQAANAKNEWKYHGTKRGLHAGEFGRRNGFVYRYTPGVPPPAPGPPLTPSPPGSPVVRVQHVVRSQPFVQSQPKEGPIPRSDPALIAHPNRKYGVGPSPTTPSPAVAESYRKAQQDKAMSDRAIRLQGAPGVKASTQVTPSENQSNTNTNTLPFRPMQRPSTAEPQENNTTTLPYRPSYHDHLNASGNIPPRALSPDWTKNPMDPRNRPQKKY